MGRGDSTYEILSMNSWFGFFIVEGHGWGGGITMCKTLWNRDVLYKFRVSFSVSFLYIVKEEVGLVFWIKKISFWNSSGKTAKISVSTKDKWKYIYLEWRFVDLNVGEDLVEKWQLPRPVGVCDAVVPHPGAEDELVGAVLQAPLGNDQLSAVHRQRRDRGDFLNLKKFQLRNVIRRVCSPEVTRPGTCLVSYIWRNYVICNLD